ncbi:MAG: transcriptional regulator [Caldithrix sp.]|nr:transcriptional regulator [Caldithrix sp.]
MDIPRYWRLRNQRYKLEGSRCKACGKLFFPPRQICTKCKKREMEPYRFSGRGTIYSYTTVYQTSERFEKQLPSIFAIVKLEEDVLVTAQLADIQEWAVKIGMEVKMVVRKIYEEKQTGPIMYGYKFRPLIDVD